MNKALFSSAKEDWETPQAFFDALDQEFHFTLDAAATSQNKKCKNYLSDALVLDWESCSEGPIWLNPPYGRNVTGKWVAKAYKTSQKGRTVVCLLPARTDTRWWHEYVIGGRAEVRFVKGRLKFGGAKHGAPFPSAVVVFHASTPIPFG